MIASQGYGEHRETTLTEALSYTLWNTIGILNIVRKKAMLIPSMDNIYKLREREEKGKKRQARV